MSLQGTEVGVLELSPSASIRVALVEWKGERGIDIRKCIRTSTFEGLSQQGIRVHKNALDQIVKLLGAFTEDGESKEDRVLGVVAKAFETDIVVQVTSYSGSPKVDIREAFRNESGRNFTKKGISIPLKYAKPLCSLLSEAKWLHENS